MSGEEPAESSEGQLHDVADRSERQSSLRASALAIDALIGSAVNPKKTDNDNAPEKSLQQLAKELDELRLKDHRLDHNLKRALGRWSIRLLGAQMVLTNTACIAYGVVVVRRGGELPTEALIGWMSATIVEIVALALVVAKYLFPESGNNWNQEPSRGHLGGD